MDKILEFKKPALHQQTMDSRYMELVRLEAIREKCWTHVCPGIGLIFQEETVCGRCGQRK